MSGKGRVGRNITAAQSEEMKRLRGLGWSAQQVADHMGVGRNTVLRHTKLPRGARRGNQWGITTAVFDAWGEPIDPLLLEDVKVPHYPDDLPDLEIDDFNWTPEELDDAVQEARRWLFVD